MVAGDRSKSPSPPPSPPPAERWPAASAERPVPPIAILSGERAPPPGTRLTCPVCGDEFALEERHPMRHYQGKAIIFCCDRCLPHFDKNPDLFVGQ
jgi:YHS domain-containing protein